MMRCMGKDARLTVEHLEDRLLLDAAVGYRSFDGTGNNRGHDDWGAANTQLLRLTTVEYGAGNAGDFPALAPRLDAAGNTINPRTISNELFDQDADALNNRGLTSFAFQWGQFLDHDMDLTEDFAPVGAATVPGEDISFAVPPGDEELPPSVLFIPQLRSRFELDDDGIAQQINQITSYIDASNVYGSNNERAEALRTHFGGFLLTSDGTTNVSDGSGAFLPFNFEVDGEFIENASPPTTGTGVPLEPDDLFVAGDVRANEQPGLTTMHTLFAREHNYQARRLADRFGFDEDDLAKPRVDEFVFQEARRIVSAEVQAITYYEFLPALLGPDQLDSYSGYDRHVNSSIANIFSASLYRVGHTMLPNQLELLNADGTAVPDNPDVLGASVEDGKVDLGEAFFNPELVTQYGIEPYLKGLSAQQIQEIDHLIVDGVRNLLFDPPAAIDLGATNLQRGRDHGLADYNQTRVDYGLDPAGSFSDISSDATVVAKLEAAYDAANDGVNGYDAVNNIDVFAGAVSEDHIPGGSVGELIHTVLVDQFGRLRDGDRFYFEKVFHGGKLDEILNTRLSDIIRRNTPLQNVQDEIFRTESVFTYRPDEGHFGVNVTLRVRDDQVEVVRGFGTHVVASQPLAETDIVVLFGTSKSDVIRIDASAATALADAGVTVEVHGGGHWDTLIVDGTTANDDIAVAASEIRVNGLSVFYGNVEKIIVQAGQGDDLARVEGAVDASVVLSGGRGNDILVGSEGNDVLLGGRGRDILIGGNGIDFLYGERGQDILLGGTVNLDNDELQDIRAVWVSNASRAERTEQVLVLLGDSVEDDGRLDFLIGGLGFDFYPFRFAGDVVLS